MAKFLKKFLASILASRKTASRLAENSFHKYTDEEWAGFMNKPTI